MAKLTQEDLRKMMPEKRKAYEKRKKRVERNRKILAGFVCITLVLVTVLALSLTVFFKIDTIKVKGDSVYDETQIINASGITKGSNLFLCDLQRASDGIKKNLPYISKAEVSRGIPSTIVINIGAAKAYMAVKTSSGTAITDKEGKVLELVSGDKVPSKVIKLDAGTVFAAKLGENVFDSNNGKEAGKEQKKKSETLKTVFDAIENSGLDGISAIDIKSAANIFIMYQNRLKLNIGTVNDIDYKLKAAVEIIKKEDEINSKEKGEIFLSNPDNIYVSPEKN